MNDPDRLMQSGANDFEARLLRAGRSDAISEQSRRVIVSGLGLGGVMLWASGLMAAVQKAGKGWLTAGAVRWVGVGALSGAALWAGMKLHEPSAPVSAPHKVVAATSKVAPIAPQVESAPLPPIEEAKPAEEKAKALSARARANRSSIATNDKSTLAEELAMVDLARAALARKDTAQSLRLLDEYTHRFSPRRLETEATVLRIEALSAAGDRATASRLGQTFLSRHPQGPYARRVRSLIGAAE
ncbi:MAG TPA: hypothetical protein VFQ35_11910 [Polyangiaceae bacterium]|nr:hypothetical protein [Polyangiaceae bacterium]